MQTAASILQQSLTQYAAHQNLDANNVTIVRDDALGHAQRRPTDVISRGLNAPTAETRLLSIHNTPAPASRWLPQQSSGSNTSSLAPRLPQRRGSFDQMD